MTKLIRLGLVGEDLRTRALAARLGPGSDFAHGHFRLQAMAPSWEEIVRDPAVDAVFVGGIAEGRAAAATAALTAGKHVLCPLPVALTQEELEQVELAQRQGNGVFLAPADLGFTMAGRQALDLLDAGELGSLHAIYCAVRCRMLDPGAAADVLAELGWEALDYILSCTGGSLPERVYAAGGRLFGVGAGLDSLLLTLRFPGDLIATIELAHSLPPDFPAPAGEAEVDLTGATGALRIEPYKVAVSVFGADVPPARQRRLWHTQPVVAMLEAFRQAIAEGKTGTEAIARNRALLRLMDAIRKSAAECNVVRLQSPCTG